MRFDVQTELKKIAKGKSSKVPTAIVLRTAVSFLEAYRKAERDAQSPSIDWLEELYRLEDSRG